MFADESGAGSAVPVAGSGARLPEQLGRLLAQLPAAGLAVLTDIDGTISPIAPRPSAAFIDPACRRALERLVEVLPLVACLSGRAVAEAAELVGVPGVRYSGSHGMEELYGGHTTLAPEAEERVADVLAAAARLRLPDGSGVMVERKPASIALHYRQTLDVAATHRALAEACAEATTGLPLRVLPGRLVLEIVPDVAVDKGTVAARLLQTHHPAGALYLGDDVTDLPAFAALADWGKATGRTALRLAVHSSEGPPALRAMADYVVEGVPGVATVLTALSDRYSPGGRDAGPASAPPLQQRGDVGALLRSPIADGACGHACTQPANDFAFWARGALGDQVLGEALASVDTIQYATLAGLRDALDQRLEAYLAAGPLRRMAPPGQEFHFMKARTFVVPTGLEAHSLGEFREMLGRVTVHSLYFHMFEARLRLGQLTNDFSAWFQDTLDLPTLANEVARLDPYTRTLEGLRRRLTQAVDRALRSGGANA